LSRVGRTISSPLLYDVPPQSMLRPSGSLRVTVTSVSSSVAIMRAVTKVSKIVKYHIKKNDYSRKKWEIYEIHLIVKKP